MPSPSANSVLLIEEGGIGGVADYTDQLADAIAKAGWEAHLATGRDHDRDAPPGVNVHRVYAYLRGGSVLARSIRRAGLARAANGLAHLAAAIPVALLARRCEIVHIQGEEWPPLGAAQALLLKAARRPIVYTPHNTFSRGQQTYRRSNALIRGCAAKIVVHSHYDLASLSATQARKAAVIPHGEYGALAQAAPAVDREGARGRLGCQENELVVLLFGQLRTDKGVRDLLLAAAETTGVKVAIAGEDKGALNEVGDLLDDERLRNRLLMHEGFVSSTAMGDLFSASDVVALPYRHASASGVLLLAYGFRRPVLAYPVGGLPEYVEDGLTGWLAERADPDALARCLAAIVLAGREECRRRGEAGWHLSRERFGWPEIARQTINLYEDALRALGRST